MVDNCDQRSSTLIKLNEEMTPVVKFWLNLDPHSSKWNMFIVQIWFRVDQTWSHIKFKQVVGSKLVGGAWVTSPYIYIYIYVYKVYAARCASPIDLGRDTVNVGYAKQANSVSIDWVWSRSRKMFDEAEKWNKFASRASVRQFIDKFAGNSRSPNVLTLI